MPNWCYNTLNVEGSKKELALFKNWVERLTYQVRSLGQEPVPFITKPMEFKYYDPKTEPLNPSDIQE